MNLKLLRLTNCLGIEEKEIVLGKVTLIDGASETGKTSIIDSIRKGLRNEDVRPKFVNGENKGIVFMQFDDDLEITRTVKTDNKSTLKVTKEGMTPQAPQNYINQLLGANDFAPIDWLKKKDKEQTEDLLKLLDIKVTPADIEKLLGERVAANYEDHGLVVCEQIEKHLMEVRKEVNADVKAYKVNIDDAKLELPRNYDADRFRFVKLNEMFEKITEADRVNNLIEKAKDRIANAHDMVENFNNEYEQRLADLQAEFERRKSQLAESRDEKIKEISEKVSAAEKFLKENTVIDTEKMREEVREIEEGQSYLRTYDNMLVAKKEYEKWSKKADELTTMIEKIRDYPAELLAKATSPIEGMGIEDGTITINGLPIKNLSDGAKMRLAIKVAKATAGSLKLILLNGFEQLNWSLQKEMLKEMQNDEYQYVITRVSDGDLSVSYIENNRIINAETGEMLEI